MKGIKLTRKNEDFLAHLASLESKGTDEFVGTKLQRLQSEAAHAKGESRRMHDDIKYLEERSALGHLPPKSRR